jgi:hypothetical protein
MPQVGFEAAIPVFERSKTIDALDRTATRTGPNNLMEFLNLSLHIILSTYVFGILWNKIVTV